MNLRSAGGWLFLKVNIACVRVCSCACVCSVGYAVLLINYRGSTGYGSKAIESLVGKCGTQDVRHFICDFDVLCSSRCRMVF